MAAMVKTQSALVGGPNGGIVLSHSTPATQETLAYDQVAVAVKAVSLNPVDTKMTGSYHTPGAVLGCEFAGVVTSVGPVASSTRGIHVGDRIGATIMGMNPLLPDIGAFAQHTVAPAHVVLKMRDDWTFAQAAGLGNAWYTVPWALFNSLGLTPGPRLEPLHSFIQRKDSARINKPDSTSGTTVLVNGGSSSTGTCAIQLLKLAGLDVITTCSPHNFELARSYGADAVFDYTSPTCAADIRARTRNSLRLVLDCITTPETTLLCYAALGRAGGRYVALEPYSEAAAATRGVVKASWVLGPELIGEDIVWPSPHGREANPAAKAFCEQWNRTLQRLLDQGSIRTHPLCIRNTGLNGVLQGLDDIREKRVSGQKLVYTL